MVCDRAALFTDHDRVDDNAACGSYVILNSNPNAPQTLASPSARICWRPMM
jgi:hypothetical protein